jgi:uncharacterized protein (TIGR03435 family)
MLAILPASVLFAQDLTGTWQGTVRNPDTRTDLRTVLKIQSSEGNPIKANFYSIDQTYLVFPATIAVQNPTPGSTLKMSIPGIGATWEGKLSADGTTLSGTLKGFSVAVTWTMKRVGPEEAWSIPAPPARPKPLVADDPTFEVASIKQSNPDERGRGIRLQGGNVSVVNMPLSDLMTLVYDLHPTQLIGLPPWATTERYDVTAKTEGEGQPSPDQLKIMMRKLLAGRFRLVAHNDRRELPVYTLGLAKGGAKISANDPSKTSATNGIIGRGPGSVLFNNTTIDDFCKMLQSGAVDRPVVNQTGLTGKYDFSLVWTPPQLENAPPNPNALGPADRAEAPPDIYTALQQQLGFRAEGTKLRIDVLVVDNVEKPSGN